MAPIELAQIETIAKRFNAEHLVVEFVRGILLPRNRNIEAIKVLNRLHKGIQSSFRGRNPNSPSKVLLWALSALELEEMGAASNRPAEDVFISRVEKTLEQICDDRASGLTVSSSGLLNTDLPTISEGSPGAFEIQCIWINALFLLGKRRPKWTVLQQQASSSFLQRFFTGNKGGKSRSNGNAEQFHADRILTLGRFPCVLLPYDLAKQVLGRFTTTKMADAENFDRLYLPAVAESQKRILGAIDGGVASLLQEIQNELATRIKKISTVADARLAIEFERWRERKDYPFEIAQPKRRRQLAVSDTITKRSATEAVEHAIESTIGLPVNEFSVAIEGQRVIVNATVPSYYVRQLVEQNSRSIVVNHLRKEFVSRVVVKRKEDD